MLPFKYTTNAKTVWEVQRRSFPPTGNLEGGGLRCIGTPPPFFLKWSAARTHQFHFVGKDQSQWLSELR